MRQQKTHFQLERFCNLHTNITFFLLTLLGGFKQRNRTGRDGAVDRNIWSGLLNRYSMLSAIRSGSLGVRNVCQLKVVAFNPCLKVKSTVFIDFVEEFMKFAEFFRNNMLNHQTLALATRKRNWTLA